MILCRSGKQTTEELHSPKVNQLWRAGMQLEWGRLVLGTLRGTVTPDLWLLSKSGLWTGTVEIMQEDGRDVNFQPCSRSTESETLGVEGCRLRLHEPVRQLWSMLVWEPLLYPTSLQVLKNARGMGCSVKATKPRLLNDARQSVSSEHGPERVRKPHSEVGNSGFGKTDSADMSLVLPLILKPRVKMKNFSFVKIQ